MTPSHPIQYEREPGNNTHMQHTKHIRSANSTKHTLTKQVNRQHIYVSLSSILPLLSELPLPH